MATATSNFIHIGNFADLDPDESNYSGENPNAVLGSYDYGDMTNAQVTQNDANDDGRMQENDNGQTGDTFSYDVGNGPTTSALDYAARYNATYTDQNGDTHNIQLSLYQTENGDVFLNPPNGLQIKNIEITGRASDGYSAITHGTSSSARAVCFAPGTMIDTPDGPRAVEHLVVGDLVTTVDRGAQPVRWLHRAAHSLDTPDPRSKPVLIAAQAFGPGRPERDLVVSPQHRVLLGGRGQLDSLFDDEVLAPAKSLVDLPRIRHMRGKKTITWVHFALERHEAVYANGCISETLLLGPMVLNGLSLSQQRVLADMYGATGSQRSALNGPEARRCVSVRDVQGRIAHLKARIRPALKMAAG